MSAALPFVVGTLAVCAVGAAVAAFVTWLRRFDSSCILLAGLFLAGGIWAAGEAGRLLAVDVESQLRWQAIEALGATPASTLWLLLVLWSAGHAADLTRRNLLLLGVVPVVTLVLTWTAGSHSLLGAGWRIDNAHGWPRLIAEPGPWHWFDLAYRTVLIGTGLAILARQYRISTGLLRRPAAILVGSMLLPWSGLLAVLAQYLAGTVPTWSGSLVPAGFTLGTLPIALAIRRAGLLELVPIARERLFDAMADGFVVVDRKRRIVDLNAVASRLLGARDSLLGRDLGAALPTWPLEAILPREMPMSSVELEAGSGHSVPLDVRSTALRDRGGRLQGWLLIARDIREQKRAERERLQFEEGLRQAQKQESLGLMAGGVAHDFNNLFMALMGNVELALLTVPDGDEVQPMLLRVQDGLEQAAELSRQMLAYAGKARIERRAIDVSQSIDAFRQLLEATVPSSVALRFELEPEMAAVEGDPSQLRQVVLNLVANAAEAVSGGGTIVVRTHASTPGATSSDREPADALEPTAIFPSGAEPVANAVVIEVRDDGHGIESGDLERIFDPFFSTKFTGRGLGLASVLGIVRAHRGTVEVHSTPGKGARFTVRLPVVDRPVDTDGVIEAGATTPVSGTVLLVDDEAPVRTVTRRMLEALGCTVLEAAGGKQALALVRDRGNTIDASIIDLTMPGMTGMEVLRAIRTVRPDLPAVLSSGYDAKDTREAHPETPIADFLEKPFSLERLRQCVEKMLRPVDSGPGAGAVVVLTEPTGTDPGRSFPDSSDRGDRRLA